jgi:hypothetical protein
MRMVTTPKPLLAPAPPQPWDPPQTASGLPIVLFSSPYFERQEVVVPLRRHFLTLATKRPLDSRCLFFDAGLDLSMCRDERCSGVSINDQSVGIPTKFGYSQHIQSCDSSHTCSHRTTQDRQARDLKLGDFRYL